MNMTDQSTLTRRLDFWRASVTGLFCVLHLAIACLLATVDGGYHPFAAIVYAISYFSMLGVGLMMLKQESHRFSWMLFLVFEAVVSLVMISIAASLITEWLLMEFAN